MRKNRLWLASVVAGLMLQSCTLAHYEIRNELSGSNSQAVRREPCNIQFSLSVKWVTRQFTQVHKPNEEWAGEAKPQYILFTRDVFKKSGCEANYTEKIEEASFNAHVLISPLRSALPQEWLTGLSFGIIPNWGTREEEFIYTFEDTKIGKKHSYLVDQKSFSHLMVFPIFWVTFITLDEEKIYKDALTNFIENSYSSAAAAEPRR